MWSVERLIDIDIFSGRERSDYFRQILVACFIEKAAVVWSENQQHFQVFVLVLVQFVFNDVCYLVLACHWILHDIDDYCPCSFIHLNFVKH